MPSNPLGNFMEVWKQLYESRARKVDSSNAQQQTLSLQLDDTEEIPAN